MRGSVAPSTEGAGRGDATPRLSSSVALRLPRFGLQGRMAASYVIVTAAAVLLVELAAVLTVLPNLASRFDFERRIAFSAGLVASATAQANQASDALALPTGYVIGDPDADPWSVQAVGSGIAIPQVAGPAPTNPDGSAKAFNPPVALVLDSDLIIRASTFPVRYPVGRSARVLIPMSKPTDVVGVGDTAHGAVTYAAVSVVIGPEKPVSSAVPPNAAPSGKSASGPGKSLIGWAYVQAPGTVLASQAALGLPSLSALATLPDSSVGPLLIAGAVLLALLLPLGAGFGVWTSRRLVSRLGGLAVATADFAGGDLARRVTEGGQDEVGQVEQGFNEMATRIERMTEERARLVEDRARMEERARIARELHDSISQDLFSVSLIAGGLQRALPPESSLQTEINVMRTTIEASMNEMRALLLELRPTALDERGLLVALNELCAAYQERLGVRIDAKLDPVQVEPPKDHVVLRVAQEGIANAVRHADASHIGLELSQRDGHTELVITDDGRGFELSRADGSHGLGLRVMRERLSELGGSLDLTSEIGRGTRLVAVLPS